MFAEDMLASMTPFYLLEWYMRNSDRARKLTLAQAIELYFKDKGAAVIISDTYITIKVGVQTARIEKPEWIESISDSLYDTKTGKEDLSLNNRDNVILEFARHI